MKNKKFMSIPANIYNIFKIYLNNKYIIFEINIIIKN